MPEKIGLEAVLDVSNFTSGLKSYLDGINEMEDVTTELANNIGNSFFDITSSIIDTGDISIVAIRELLDEIKKISTVSEKTSAAFVANNRKMLDVVTVTNEAVGSGGVSAFSSLSGAIKETTSSVASFALDLAKISFVGIGAGIAGIGVAATSVASDFSQVNREFQSQLGISADKAEQFTNIARDVWKTGFVDNADEAKQSIILISQQLENLTQEGIGKAAIAVEQLAGNFDVTREEVVNAASALTSGFGISSQEAFDFISAGFQKGLNSSDDFLDSIREYSVQFSNAGADAGQFFSLLDTGLQAGVLGTDKAADLFKEFSLRVSDGSDAVKDAGIQLFGLTNATSLNADAIEKEQDKLRTLQGQLSVASSARANYNSKTSASVRLNNQLRLDELNRKIQEQKDKITALSSAQQGAVQAGFDWVALQEGLANGTISTTEAFQASITALKNVKDNTQRAALATAIFGTQYEDLGDAALLNIDITRTSLGDLAGSTDSLGETFRNTTTLLTELWRSVQLAIEPIGTAILDIANEALPIIIDAVNGFAPSIREMASTFGELFDGVGEQIGNAIASFLPSGETIQSFAERLATFFRETLVPALVGFGEWWSVNGGTVAEIAASIFSGILDFGASLAAFVVETLIPQIAAFGEWWVQNSPEIMQIATNLFLSIGNTMSNLAGFVVNTLLPSFSFIAEWWAVQGAQLASTALDVLSTIFYAISNLLLPAFNSFLQWLEQNMPFIQAAILTAFTVINAVISEVATFLVTRVFPELMNAWVEITESLAVLGIDWESTLSTMGEIATYVFGAIGAVIVTLVAGIGSFVTAALSAFGTFLDGTQTLWKGVTQFVDGIILLFQGDLAGGVKNIIEGLANTLVGLFDATFGVIIDFVWTFISDFIGFFVGLYDTLVGGSIIPNMMNDIVSVISDGFYSVINFVVEFVSNFIAMIVDMATTVVSTISTFVIGIAEQFRLMVTNIVSFVSNLISQVSGGFSNLANGVTSTVSSFVSNVSSSFLSVVTNIIASISSFISNVSSKFQDMASRSLQSLSMFVSGVTEWFSTMVTSVTERVSTFVSGIIERFRDMISNVTGNVSTFASDVIGNFTTMASGVIERVSTFANGLVERFTTMTSDVTSRVSTFVSSIIERFATMISSVVERVSTFASSIVQNFVTMSSNVIERISTFAIGLVERFNTMISDVVERVTTFSGNIIEQFTTMINNVFEKVSTFASAILERFTTMKDDIIERVSTFVSSIIEHFTTMKDDIVERVSTFVSEFTSRVSTLTSDVVSRFATMIDDVVARVTAFKDSIVTRFSEIVTNVTDRVATLKDDIIATIGTMVSTAFESISNFSTSIITKFEEMVTSVTTKITSIKDTIVGKFNELVTSAGTFGTNILTSIQTTMQGMIDRVTQTDWLQAGKDILNDIISGIENVVNDVLTLAFNIGGQILDKFKESNWIQLGVDIINGIVTGINNTVNNIVTAAQNAAQAAFSAAQQTLGISSPSKLFMEIGTDIAEGMALGMNAGNQLVSGAGQQLAFSSLPPNLGSSTTVNNNNGGNTTMNVNMNTAASSTEIVPRLRVLQGLI